ncbi:MAG: FAD-binding oxidoreductase, partial [Dehalococcoidia bacterium]|nr:FAD-binding oxidoreductase [Dehalococcoidia bacterium]
MIDVEGLKGIVGEDWVITQRDQMEAYLYDETTPYQRLTPAEHVVVVKPVTAEEISQILKVANRDKTPVYPRGAGTGLVCGAMPTQDGIVISMERFDKVEEVDKENLMVVAEAGVTLAQLLEAVDGADLLFPPHPGDEGAQVGGMIAANAGGSRAVKYGVVRQYVKGLEVVLPTGEITTMGGKLLKNNTGLDLMHLMIDSEGILGIITKATMRLYPKFSGTATLVVSFEDRHMAIASVPKILQSGVIPMAIEYVDHDVIEFSADNLGMKWPAQQGKAHLILILAGANEDDVYFQAETMSEVCTSNGAIDVLIAERQQEQGDILKMRSEIYSAMKPRIAGDSDITVPPANLGKMLDALDEIGAKYDTRIATIAHAGDGNFHPYMLKELIEKGTAEDVKLEIYKAAISLDGVITGEHGVGKIRLKYLQYQMDPKQEEIMRGIKKVFDP